MVMLSVTCWIRLPASRCGRHSPFLRAAPARSLLGDALSHCQAHNSHAAIGQAYLTVERTNYSFPLSVLRSALAGRSDETRCPPPCTVINPFQQKSRITHFWASTKALPLSWM